MAFQGCGPILQSKQCRSWVPSGVIKLFNSNLPMICPMMSYHFPICFLWCSCIVLWFSHDFPSKLALQLTRTPVRAQPPGDLRRHGRPFKDWPKVTTGAPRESETKRWHWLNHNIMFFMGIWFNMGILWEYYGNMMVAPWEYYGNMIGIFAQWYSICPYSNVNIIYAF